MGKRLILFSSLLFMSVIVSLSSFGFSTPNITNFTYPHGYVKTYTPINISASVTDNETLEKLRKKYLEIENILEESL